MPSLELAVPPVRQRENYTCGPAAVLSALRYLGLDEGDTEASLAAEMGTTRAAGTESAAMVTALRARLDEADDVRVYLNLSLADLRAHVRRGDLAICALQAWQEARSACYGPPWQDGHWVIATAVRRGDVVFCDPSHRGARTTLTHADLRRRWADIDGGAVVRGLAIVISGHEPRTRRLGRTRPMG